MTSNIVLLILDPIVAFKKSSIVRLSRAVMRAKRRDDLAILNSRLAFAHLGLGRVLSFYAGAGDPAHPLWRELKLALECYERIDAGSDEEEYHRLRSILYQGVALVTMRMADRHHDASLRATALKRLDTAFQSADLSKNPHEKARIYSLRERWTGRWQMAA